MQYRTALDLHIATARKLGEEGKNTSRVLFAPVASAVLGVLVGLGGETFHSNIKNAKKGTRLSTFLLQLEILPRGCPASLSFNGLSASFM